MTRSALDGIPGVGEAKRKALLKEFGSLKRLRAATTEEMMAVPGIGSALAATIAAQLASGAGAQPAINLSTGEVLDDDAE